MTLDQGTWVEGGAAGAGAWDGAAACGAAGSVEPSGWALVVGGSWAAAFPPGEPMAIASASRATTAIVRFNNPSLACGGRVSPPSRHGSRPAPRVGCEVAHAPLERIASATVNRYSSAAGSPTTSASFSARVHCLIDARA